MNIYLVTQDVDNGYDTYDSFVVVAENEDTARHTSPDSYYVWKDNTWNFLFENGCCEPSYCSEWCLPEQVEVTLIGKADDKYTETTVICTSFNAG